MAINEKWNKRIDITLPKTQYNWIEANAKKLEVSKSKFISWILARRIKNILEELKIYDSESLMETRELIEKDIETPTDEEIKELMDKINSQKIIKF